jgi:DNA-binding GntR family transcriptional regulator
VAKWPYILIIKPDSQWEPTVPWPDEAAHVIAGELRAQLEDGHLRTGAVMSSEAQLSTSYLFSQSARISLRLLAADGLVVRLPGQGTFAAPPAHQALSARQSREQIR